MKAFGQVITQLAVSYVRFGNGADNIKVLWNMMTCRLVNKKVKQFRYRPGVAQRVPGS
jgi:hypothetical protein